MPIHYTRNQRNPNVVGFSWVLLGGRLFFRLLVRGAVLARSEGVVGKDEEGVGPHERSQADGRFAVVGEAGEG